MMCTRIGWGIAESQGRIDCDLALRAWRASGLGLKTKQNHRCTSVLIRDGATRGDAVPDIIQRGAPMINDG